MESDKKVKKVTRFPKTLRVIHAFGPTMAGKGLLGDIFALHNRVERHVARNMIAAEAADDAVFEALATEHELAGTLIPCARINQLVDKRLVRPPEGVGLLWTDGIGRTLEQADGMNEIFTGLDPANINVLHFDTTPEALLRRYHEKNKAPDRAGRRDAKLPIHERRVREYYETERALLARYRSFGWQIIRLDATNSAVHKTKQIRQVLKLGKLTQSQLEQVRHLIEERTVIPVQFTPEEVRLEA